MPHHFHAEQFLPYPLETVFTFFADPANLPRLMPPWQCARIVDATYLFPPRPEREFPGSEAIIAGDGTTLTLSIRPIPFSPVRLSWVALIEDFRWLQGFCDVQLRGPFRTWRHCHTVTTATSPTNGEPGTMLRDTVTYELPLGPLGRLANLLFVRRQLAGIFSFRQRRTLELLGLQGAEAQIVPRGTIESTT
jgi:ligand-binding SRPBCC domain-containing protein